MKLASLPTDLGVRIIGDLVKTRLTRIEYVKESVCAFQRMALASADIEDCITAMEFWFKPESKKWSKPEKDRLVICQEITKKDVLGIAIEALVQISAKENGPARERIAAATILNELFGDKELVDTGALTEGLIVNLSAK